MFSHLKHSSDKPSAQLYNVTRWIALILIVKKRRELLSKSEQKPQQVSLKSFQLHCVHCWLATLRARMHKSGSQSECKSLIWARLATI